MLGLPADAHADAHLAALAGVCQRPEWTEIWNHLGVRTYSFRDVSLDPNIIDSKLWHFCQREKLLLVTANRNSDGTDSLEATIRTATTIQSLPVLTIADGRQLLKIRSYAERAAIRLLEILLDLDSYRGSGRLFLPAKPG